VDIRISGEGDVDDIRVASDLGEGLADEAVKAVKKWKFKPARGRDGNLGENHC
jgi:TonB family protein